MRCRSSARTPARGRAGSSSRATSPTGRLQRCGRGSPCVTNVDLDHHTEFGSRAEVEALFDAGWRRCRRSCAAGSSSRVDVELAVPGEHNRRNAAAGAGGARAGRRPARRRRSPRSRVRGGRSPLRARRRGRRGDGVRRLRAQPGEGPGRDRDARGSVRERTRARALPAASLLAHARISARGARRGRSPRPTSSPSRTSTRRASSRSTGVTGKLVVDALCDARPGFAPGWTPRLEDGARFLARRARPGDLVLTVGAGDVDRAARLILEVLADAVVKIEEGVPLARLTTVGIGGPARALARPADARPSSRRRSPGRAEHGLPVRPIGLGSNLLAADDGVDALVVRLDGEPRRRRGARRPARRRRRRAERRLPPPRAGRRARRLRVRVRDPRHGRRRRADERRRVRQRLEGDSRARARRRRRRRRAGTTNDELDLFVPALRARARAGRRAGRVPARAASVRGDQGDGRRRSRRSARRPSRRTSARSAASSRTRTTSSAPGG